jgi:hypothetical protein
MGVIAAHNTTEIPQEAAMLKSFAVAALLALVLFPALSSAQNPNPPLSAARQEMIEKNLVAGLQHPSCLVRGDYVRLVIDLKRAYPTLDFDYAIIPLMGLLKSDENECVRIFAALALYQFEDSDRGRFAVSQAIRHDDSDRLRRHCSTLIRKWDNREPAPNYVAMVSYPF